MRRTTLALSAALGLGLAVLAAGRPLTAPLSPRVEMAEMTWVELRGAVQAGRRVAIVPSGGIEQNGVHMALGKHDAIVREAAARIAAGLGDALVAPVIPYVPQSGNLRFPGTIGIGPEVFAGLLEGIARSLKGSGFTTIAFLADHGESGPVQAGLARRLDRDWAAEGVRVIAVDAYSDLAPQVAWLVAQGESEATIGRHAGIPDTAQLMAVRPDLVDLARLGDARWRLEPTGSDGDPARASRERGEALLQARVEAAVRQIRAATARPRG